MANRTQKVRLVGTGAWCWCLCAILVLFACRSSEPSNPAPVALAAAVELPGQEEPALVEVTTYPVYQTVRRERTGRLDRVQYRISILVPANHDREQLIAALSDAVQQTFERQPDAIAVAVFAFTNPAHVGRRFDTGRALASRDGQGWSGDRSFGPFLRESDHGLVRITLGNAVDGLEQLAIAPT